VRNAKLVDLHWHDLRRTFGHRLRAAGVRIEDIKALLGHSRKADVTENHYAVPVLDNLREAVAKLDPKKTGEQTAKETAKPEILAFRKAASA
jgi:integrase